MPIRLYHNPQCSKSRQALELLRKKNVDFTVIEYLETPLTSDELELLLTQLDAEPRDIIRKGEQEYTQANLHDTSLTSSQLIDAIVNHPRLLQRPIVVKDGKAAIGRPVENIIALLS